MAITYSLIPVDTGGDDQPEGTGTPTDYRFLVFRSSIDSDSFPEETLDWSVSGSGTSAAEGSDFSLDGFFPNGSVHFSAGSFQADSYIEFNTVADSVAEFDEGFSLTLLNGAFVLASATGIIRNDDFNLVGGTSGADNLVGSSFSDLLVGIGDDTLTGLGGNDTYAIRDGRLGGKTLVEAANGGAADVLSIEATLAGNIVPVGSSFSGANIEQLRIASSLSGVTFVDQDGIANDWTFDFEMDAVSLAALGGFDLGAGDDELDFDLAIPTDPLAPVDPFRVAMGAGHDTLHVTLNDFLLSDPYRGLGLVDLGDGNDSLELDVVTAALTLDPLRIVAGAGDDDLLIDITANLSPVDPYHLLDQVELGAGSDSLNLRILADFVIPNPVRVFAGDGNDSLQLELMSDFLLTDPFRILGEGGNDQIDLSFAGSGFVDGGSGNDVISLSLLQLASASIAQTAVAAEPMVEAHGGAGIDSLFGSTAGDRLFGDGGSDLAFGGAGDDWIDLGTGTDAATGGVGADVFALSFGLDHILDFQNGIDRIALPTGVDFEDLIIRNRPGGVTITASNYEMQLVGLKAKDVDSSDFVSNDMLSLNSLSPLGLASLDVAGFG